MGQSPTVSTLSRCPTPLCGDNGTRPVPQPFSGPSAGTGAGQVSLKTLACRIMARDRSRDKCGTDPVPCSGTADPTLSHPCPAHGPYAQATKTAHPWPVLHALNETYKMGALPAEDGSGLILYPAAGLLLSEKEAALRYARDNLEDLLHDLALEHLPRQVRLGGRWIVPDTGSVVEMDDMRGSPRYIAPDRRSSGQGRSKKEAWK